MTALLALALPVGNRRLAHLAPVDLLILVLYFVLVIFIGFYVNQQANTSEQFFLAGRKMTAWIARLSFVSGNLGSLELIGRPAPRPAAEKFVACRAFEGQSIDALS